MDGKVLKKLRSEIAIAVGMAEEALACLAHRL